MVLLNVIECTKNQLVSWSNDKEVSWSDNKEQSLEADTKKGKVDVVLLGMVEFIEFYTLYVSLENLL